MGGVTSAASSVSGGVAAAGSCRRYLSRGGGEEVNMTPARRGGWMTRGEKYIPDVNFGRKDDSRPANWVASALGMPDQVKLHSCDFGNRWLLFEPLAVTAK